MQRSPDTFSVTRRRFLQGLSLPLVSAVAAGCGAMGRAGAGASERAAPLFESDHPLAGLRFIDQGVVRKEMRFEYVPQPVHVGEGIEAWHVKGQLPYLQEVYGEEGGRQFQAPPLGMRSGMPLGGMGGGTVEIHADGSLRDWRLLNASPAGEGLKVDVPDFFLGLRTQSADEAPRAWALRTHPPAGLPGVDEMAFAGAYPVARLVPTAAGLPLEVAWYAYSPFLINDSGFTGTPALAFTLLLRNPGRTPVHASALCTLPNVVEGTYRLQRGITLTRAGETPTSGTMTLETVTGFNLSSMVAGELTDIWQVFTRDGAFDGQPAMGLSGYAAAAASAVVEPGTTQAVTFVLSWHFPHRRFFKTRVGQGYSARYTDAPAAAAAMIDRLPEIWKSLFTWQALCLDGDLPDPLKEGLANAPALLARSAVFTENRHWRFWDSPSDLAYGALSVSLYRALLLALTYPDILHDQLRAYASVQADNGQMPAALGIGRSTSFDAPTGEPTAESGPGFILQSYALLRATGDRHVLAELWPHVQKTILWQAARAERLGLPDRLDTTYRWWDHRSRDLTAYGSLLHLAAARAALTMARMAEDSAAATTIQQLLTRGMDTFEATFWTGDHYRAWHTEGEPATDALQADTLYGLLWCLLLGLEPVIDLDRARGHLRQERRRNTSPYGMRAQRGAGQDNDGLDPQTPYRFLAEGRGGPTDDVVWQAATYHSAALAILLDIDPREAVASAARAAEHQARTLREPWNPYEMLAGWDGSPWAYSGHPAALGIWLVPLALTGQRYDALSRSLDFAPRSGAGRTPFLTPDARGSLENLGGGRYSLHVTEGRLILETLRIGEDHLQRDILLEAGQTLRIG